MSDWTSNPAVRKAAADLRAHRDTWKVRRWFALGLALSALALGRWVTGAAEAGLGRIADHPPGEIPVALSAGLASSRAEGRTIFLFGVGLTVFVLVRWRNALRPEQIILLEALDQQRLEQLVGESPSSPAR